MGKCTKTVDKDGKEITKVLVKKLNMEHMV